jgi:hypothetical protein
VKIRPKPASARPSVPLSREETFLLSRIDGNLSVNDLVALTGMEPARVRQIVHKLASEGAVDVDDAPSSGYLPDPGSAPTLGGDQDTTSLADFAAALGMDPSSFAASTVSAAAQELPVAEARSNHPPPDLGEAESPISDVVPTAELEEVHDDDDEPMLLTEADEVHDEPAEVIEGDDQGTVDAASRERNYREIYAAKFHHLTTDARIAAAKVSSGAELCALCFDPEPRVIAAILENTLITLDNVRLIALHHRTGTGLEMISRRNDFIRDALVERRLLRNPQTGDMVLQRIMSTKLLAQVYRISIDREIPELTRVKSRGHLRKKWQNAPSEERAELLTRTEGRCLLQLTGCTFDSKTTQILCGKSYASAMFVQSIAKFGASPPALLAHLYKQPFVRKSPPLRKMLLQHPNMPGEVKRNG